MEARLTPARRSPARRTPARCLLPAFLTVAALALAGAAVDLRAQAGADEEVEFVPRTGTPPAKRVGAGTRGDGDLKVIGLAPARSLGYTTRAQPVVYFALSRDTAAPIEIAINDLRNAENPVCETVLERGHPRGLLKLDLSKLKTKAGEPVKLAPGGRYELAVTVDEKEAGSANATAVVPIAWVALAGAGSPPADPAKAAAWYARHGVWFDCLDALNTALATQPNDPKLLAIRRKLLEREGLSQAADGTIAEKAAAK